MNARQPSNDADCFVCPQRPRVMVLGLGDPDRVEAAARQLRPAIDEHAEIVVWNIGEEQDLADVEADLAIILGGDGSILRAAHHMGLNQTPAIGVNLGKLGFLADLSPAELIAELPHICAGRARVVEHLMFTCSVLRGDEVLVEDLGLNETSILGGPPFSILDVQLYVDAELVTTYSCDGLIVSTPVGSTAHSLSAGGPILRKDLKAFVILPISPHALTNRPVVDSADRVYEMVVCRPHPATSVVVDGRVLATLQPNDRVRVQQAEPRFKLVEAPGRSYYRTLREKLGWGGRLHPEP